MRTWPALFIPPLVFLTLLSVNYALEPYACEQQQRLAMHLTAGASLMIALASIALAFRAWRSVGGGFPSDEADSDQRTRFASIMALMLSTLSTLGIAMLWVVQVLMPPCIR